ncbi:hypothetical protein FQR65_LT10852 [Abscondita terminalis]|nr:hypothetical protein FQR65_LT10852 [Abscondita terminalis]
MAIIVAIRSFFAEKIKLLLILLLIWVSAALLSISYNQRNYGNEEIVEQLIQAKEELSTLKKYNNDLQELLTKENYQALPKPEYEKLRRRVANTIDEFWRFINSQVSHLKDKKGVNSNDLRTLNKIISLGVEHKRSLLNDVQRISQVDGFNNWRINEIKNLSNVVQERLGYLQNPVDCQNAKKLVCQINYYCGFGCQIHHLICCMALAYGTQRTLILKSVEWQYHEDGWEGVFKPLSNVCTEVDETTAVTWPGSDNSQVIALPLQTNIYPRSKYLPLAVPEDLAYRLITVHGNPSAWWVGQILNYIWKPQIITLSHIKQNTEHIKLENPYVAVHIRRTDKVRSEAKFYSVREYMAKVDEYYNEAIDSSNATMPRVYIATDDVNVITEAKTKYPHYEIMHNPNVPNISEPDYLHSKDNIFDLILDVHILSHSKFLVCTFSSNICRLAYELMQINYEDASARVASLDDVYYDLQQNTNQRITILSHRAQSAQEIDLLPGDIVHIIDNHWNGYSKGKNLRTKKHGLFPSFKVDMSMEIVKFPTYLDMHT